jgi:sugar transferase EpsL
VVEKVYSSYVKRILDLGFAIGGLLCGAPLLAVVATCVRIKMGSPILLRQRRPGLHGQLFTLLKFRTMTESRDAGGNLLPDAERLTAFGGWLRRTSLDELPELVNVLRGEMSIVGPRPLLTEYLERYTRAQSRRHEIKPGITGWAQVNGRNAISWEQRFKLDVWYVDHVSLALDARILVSTVCQVFKRQGISQGGHVTMPKFLGSRDADS